MFQPAAGIRTQMKNEGVVVIGNLATHQLYFRFDNLLYVGAHLQRVVVSLAIDHDPVRHSLNFKRNSFEVAGLDRRVVEDVEIFCAKRVSGSGHLREAGGDLPRLRYQNVQCGRLVQ